VLENLACCTTACAYPAGATKDPETSESDGYGFQEYKPAWHNSTEFDKIKGGNQFKSNS